MIINIGLKSMQHEQLQLNNLPFILSITICEYPIERKRMNENIINSILKILY